MANRFYLDASALVKRYVAETGTSLVNHLFQQAPRDHLMCLFLGTLEVISILVRKKNAQLIPAAYFQQALLDFRKEVLDASEFLKLPAGNDVVVEAAQFIERHSVNATDAVILRSALDVAASARSIGEDLVLVASDQRLLRAAKAEGVVTFDPETQDQMVLDALLS